MNLRTVGLWAIVAVALLGVAYLGYDGVRGRPAGNVIGGQVFAEFTGRSELGKPSATSPFVSSEAWAADVALIGDFDGVYVVKVRSTDRRLEALDERRLGDVAAGQERIYAPGGPTAFTHSFPVNWKFMLVFVGNGSWTARLRH